MIFRKVYLVVPIKAFIIILIGKICLFIIKHIHYNGYYSSLLSLIEYYDAKGCQVIKMHDKSLLISKVSKTPSIEKKVNYLIRPNTSDLSVFSQVIENAEYELIINMIKNFSQETNVKYVIDAGANIGLTSLYFKLYFPQSKILSIEADSNNYQQLKQNIALNSLLKDIRPINKALWDKENETLHIKNDFRDGGSWSKRVGYDAGHENSASVQSITLNHLMDEYEFDVVDILKIDIEGAEKELFKDPNFIKTISSKVKFIAIEIHEEVDMTHFIETKLKTNNFKLFKKTETSFYYNGSLVS